MIKSIVGYRKFKSKKGTSCCIINVIGDFTAYDQEHGAVGQRCEEVFLPEDQHQFVVPGIIGKPIELQYGEGYGGTPRVIGFKVVDK